jgi:2-oxoisovalerate dehydrogenase E1 component
MVDNQFVPKSKLEKVIMNSLKIRFTEQILLEAFSKGKIRGTVHTCIGQEIVATTICHFLNLGSDWVLGNHRSHGHFIACGGEPRELFLEVLGSELGVSAGMGGSQHLQKSTFMTNGIQGSLVPVAAGIAMGLHDENSIVAIFLGDGTLGEGSFWEALHSISSLKLPVLLVCEDNDIAQSTLTSSTFSGSLEKRINGFGLNYTHINSREPERCLEIAEEIIQRVRVTREPQFLHFKTYRMMAHSKGDDNRSVETLEQIKRLDPINIIMSNPDYSEIVSSINDYVSREFESAEMSLKKSNLHTESNLARSKTEQQSPTRSPFLRDATSDTTTRVHVNQALFEMFNSNSDVMMLGEDIEWISKGTVKPYGGAFKISGELSHNFPGRVLNTAISESFIVGAGTGRALTGKPTIVEIMFSDFLTLCFDQILQNTSKFTWMYGRKNDIPITIRTAGGGGFGYGATHSQSLEKFFLGIPGLDLISYNPWLDYGVILRDSIANSLPTLLVENKRDYNVKLSNFYSKKYSIVEISQANYVFKRVINKPKSPSEITFITYGGMISKCFEVQDLLNEKHSINTSVIGIGKLNSLRASTLSADLADAIIFVEEGVLFSGFHAELLAQMAETGISNRKYCIRIGGTGKIGSSQKSEDDAIPSALQIYQTAIKFIHGRSN